MVQLVCSGNGPNYSLILKSLLTTIIAEKQQSLQHRATSIIEFGHKDRRLNEVVE